MRSSSTLAFNIRQTPIHGAHGARQIGVLGTPVTSKAALPASPPPQTVAEPSFAPVAA